MALAPNSVEGELPAPATVEEALADVAAGGMVVIADDRAGIGHVVMSAESVAAEHVNFMATHARGTICVALDLARCDELGLQPVSLRHETPFTETIDALAGVTTGVSTADRAHTIRTAANASSGPEAIVKGGHVSVLRGCRGGILECSGHTEAAIDLARLAGRLPAGALCAVMSEDGAVARVDDLSDFCREFGLKLITTSALRAFRRSREKLIERVVSTRLPTAFGDFELVGYQSVIDGRGHVALVKGEIVGRKDVLVYVHTECLAGGVFQSLLCDCGPRVRSALRTIEHAGCGVLLHLCDDARRSGMSEELLRHQHADDRTGVLGFDRRPPTNLRESEVGVQMLADLGVGSVKIFT